MSRFEYQEGKRLERANYSFSALIQAAMRCADKENQEKLKVAFPAIWDELRERSKARGGLLPEEL